MAPDPYSIFTQGLPVEPTPERDSNTAPEGDGFDLFTKGLPTVPTAIDTADQPTAEEIAQSKRANAFRARTVDELKDDKSFDPLVEYFNQPDGEAKQKVLDVFKAREQSDINWGAVGMGALKAPVNVTKAFGTGIGAAAGLTANVLEGLQTKHLDRAASAVGELASGTETNVTGLLNTVETAKDFLKQKFGGGPETDEEWRALLAKKADFNEAVKEAAQGEGTISKKMLGGGIHTPTISSAVQSLGGEIDPQNSVDASPVLDPTLFIPLLAGARGAKLAATAAEVGLRFEATETGIQLVKGAGRTAKVILNAPEGSRLFKMFEGATKVTEPAIKGADVLGGFTKGVINKTTDAAATVAEKTGALATKAGEATTLTKGGLVGGAVEVLARGAAATGGFDVPGAGLAAGAAIPKVLKTAGGVLTNIGGKLRGEIPAGPLYRQLAKTANGSLAKGAVAGVGLTGDPAALAFSGLSFAGAPNDEERGAALGGQATFGAVGHFAAEGVHLAQPYSDIGGQLSKPGTPSEPVNSPGYGVAPSLDKSSAELLATQPQNIQNVVNQFREGTRDRGTHIYMVSPEDFSRGVVSFETQKAAAEGKTLSNEQLAALRDSADRRANAAGVVYGNFDLGDGVPRNVMLLNSNGGALQHEGGHVLTSLFSEPAYAEVANAIRTRYSDHELAVFQKEYEDKLGRKISEPELIDEIMAENVSAILNAVPVERLGTPKPVARSIYQHLGAVLEDFGGKPFKGRETALGVRPDAGVQRLLENTLRSQEAAARPVIEKTSKVDLSKVDLGPRGVNAGGSTNDSTIRAKGENPNIRVSREDQNRFRRAEVDNSNKKAAAAVDSNPNYGPDQKAAFVKLAAVLHQGGDRPRPVEVDYSAANSDEFNAGRTTRRAEQAAAEGAEAAGTLPENVRQMTQKVLIPERFEVRSNGEVQIVAKSLDKIIGNAYKLAADAHKNGAGLLIPYDHSNGVFTDRGWTDLTRDIQTYTKNQSYGYAGTGNAVIRPKGYLGEIPDQVTNFKPTGLSQDKSDFINTLMALPPPKTTGRQGTTKTGTPANVIARSLAEANGKQSLPSVTSNPKKNLFEAPHSVEIAEFNPLRDKLAKAGVDVRNLNEVTERINLSRVKGEVKVRNDLDFSRPSTDLMRASFMPDPRKAVRRGDPEIRDIADEYTKSSGIPYRPYDGYAKIDPELGKSLADWYDAAKTAPDDPQVKVAYDALISETKRQWDTIKQAGYTIEPWSGQGEPYHSSADMVEDVRKNKHLWFFKTDNGFGNEGTSSHNPLLQPAGGEGMVANDLFRGVHDFFGHAKEGYEFGPRGEYNAFLAHSSMFSEAALPALAAETLSQNAWVNFGKHLRDGEGHIPAKGDDGYIPLQNRPFADQKVVAVPQDLLDRALAPKTEGETTPTMKSNADDLTRYNEIQGEMSKLIKEQKGGSPEFTELWKENEAIKNRNEKDPGMPPTADAPNADSPNASYMPKEVVQHGGEKLPDSIKEKTLNLVHYAGSKAGKLKTVDPKFMSPKPGVFSKMYRGEQKSFFFVEGSRPLKEENVSGARPQYTAKVSGERLYDMDKDPQELWFNPNPAKTDQTLMDQGYVGFAVTDDKNRRFVAFYEPTKVTPKATSSFMPKAPDTPEFKKWFGDSKVVDENGEPIALYHGTMRDIGPTFKAGKDGGSLGNGIYFTPDSERAGTYTGLGSSPGNETGSNVSKVYVALKNPLMIDDGARIKDPAVMLLEKLGVAPDAAEKMFEKAMDKAGYITSQIKTKALAQGYDGIMQHRDGVLQEVVAFRPEQVKSATGNSGAFDPKNPDVRFMPAHDKPVDSTPEVAPDVKPLIKPYSAKDDGNYVIKPVGPKPPKERTGIFSTPSSSFKPKSASEGEGTTARSVSTVPIFNGSEPKPKIGSTAFEIGKGLASRSRVLARISHDSRTPAAKDAIASTLVDEIGHALAQHDNARGWYESTVTKAMDKFSEIHPELKTDPDKESLFKALLAITSNGQKVSENAHRADAIYQGWKDGGRIDTQANWGGARKNQINKGLDVLQQLIDEKGLTATAEFLNKKFTVGQLKRMGFKLSGDAVDHVVRGAAIFGPKVGAGFYANLQGDFTPVTMDLWLMRTWNRINGSYGVPSDRGMARGIAALRKAAADHPSTPEAAQITSMSDRALGNWAEKRLTEWTKKGFKNGTPFDRPAKWFSESKEGAIESPRNSNERTWVREVFAEVDKKLAAAGLPEINNADKQALLWYYEKDLYSHFGYKKRAASAQDYATAAAEVVAGRAPNAGGK